MEMHCTEYAPLRCAIGQALRDVSIFTIIPHIMIMAFVYVDIFVLRTAAAATCHMLLSRFVTILQAIFCI
jgi:hypothetical protein